MENDREPQKVPEWQRQAWLTEYQVCQQDISSSSHAYWTLAGIFIGIGTALLGGLIYGILANSDTFSIFIKTTQEFSTSADTWALRIIVSILGLGIIFILVILRRWLKREQFLAFLNYDRMHEIERAQGMWKGQRVYAVDHWDKLDETEKTKFKSHRPKRWWEQKGNYPERPGFPGYEQPSSKFHYRWLMRILIILWSLLIASVWILPLVFIFL